jgi:hypothetical protein
MGLGSPWTRPPCRKRLRAADHVHVGPPAHELVAIAALFDEVARADHGHVAREPHEQLALAPRREPEAPRQCSAEPRRGKNRLPVGDTEHLAELRRGVDLRHLGHRKAGPRVG